MESLSPLAATWAYAGAGRLHEGTCVAIVDIDGTLADASARQYLLRSEPPEWRLFSLQAGSDPPIPLTVELVRLLSGCLPIVVSSGRPSYAIDMTVHWLNEHAIPWDVVALRPENDTVPKVNHKLRVVDALRGSGLKPIIAVDDSSLVGQAYRDDGICFIQA
jgi:hypothetical protein